MRADADGVSMVTAIADGRSATSAAMAAKVFIVYVVEVVREEN
jgi:acyl CoA:acetate/3-ketoacid CoA transferase alpha subunit